MWLVQCAHHRDHILFPTGMGQYQDEVWLVQVLHKVNMLCDTMSWFAYTHIPLFLAPPCAIWGTISSRVSRSTKSYITTQNLWLPSTPPPPPPTPTTGYLFKFMITAKPAIWYNNTFISRPLTCIPFFPTPPCAIWGTNSSRVRWLTKSYHVTHKSCMDDPW